MISSSISRCSVGSNAPRTSSSVHTVSLLRIFSLGSLFLSVRSQLFPATIELSSLDGTKGFAINGIVAGDQSGISVSSAGDVNADGVVDLIIGAWYADPSGLGNAGQSYVVFGNSGLGSGGTLELSALDGTTGFTLNGITDMDQSGISVSGAGDVNADSVDDLIIGANAADPSGRREAGQSYVVFGKSGLGSGGVFELSVLNGTTGFALNGIASGHFSGASVSSAGDVNADGVADLIIGARYANPSGLGNAGQSYVVFGKSGLGSGGASELSALDGTRGFVINGIAGGDLSGTSVSSAGDVNADGVADLIIGARFAGPSGRGNAGQSYVVFGNSGLGSGGVLELSALNGTTGFALNGIVAGDQSGTSVSSAGDVNADGVDDLIVGAWQAGLSGRITAGRSYVVFGKSGLGSSGSLELSVLNGTTGFVLNGIAANDRSGLSVSSAGDVNADGVADLIIGARYAAPSGRIEAGQSYVVFGKSGLGSGGTLELSALDGMTGFVLNGIAGGDQSGVSVSSAGDVNADGVADLIIGARQASPSGHSMAGQSYVVFGRKPNTTFTSIPPSVAATEATSITFISSLLTSTQTSLPSQPSSTTTQKTHSSSALRSASTTTAAESEISRGATPSKESTILPSVHFTSVLSVAPTEPSDPPSLALPLGIAGGVCALISSIAASVLMLRKCRKPDQEQPSPQNPPSEYTAISSLGLSSSHYHQPNLQPAGSHYAGDKELQEFNRQQLEDNQAAANGHHPSSHYDEPILQPEGSHYIDIKEI